MTKEAVSRQFLLCKNAGKLALEKLVMHAPEAGNAEAVLKIVHEVLDHTEQIIPHESFTDAAVVTNKNHALTVWTSTWDLLLIHLGTLEKKKPSPRWPEENVLNELLWYNAQTSELLAVANLLILSEKDTKNRFSQADEIQYASPVCYANSPEIRDDYR